MSDKKPSISTSKTETKIQYNIKNLFENMTYSQEYNADIWITVIILFIFCYIVIYYNSISIIKAYKADWENIKCNPLFIPFAGIINEDKLADNENFVEDNFNSCLDDLNEEIGDVAKKSFNGVTSVVDDIYNSASSIMTDLINKITELFEKLFSLFKQIFARFTNLNSEISVLFATINNFISHLLGIISNVYSFVVLIVDSLKLVLCMVALAFFTVVVIPTLIATIVCIVLYFVLLALSWIPIIGAAFSAASAIALVAALLLLAFLILVILIYGVFNSSAAYILSKTLAPVSNTPAMATGSNVSAPPSPG